MCWDEIIESMLMTFDKVKLVLSRQILEITAAIYNVIVHHKGYLQEKVCLGVEIDMVLRRSDVIKWIIIKLQTTLFKWSLKQCFISKPTECKIGIMQYHSTLKHQIFKPTWFLTTRFNATTNEIYEMEILQGETLFWKEMFCYSIIKWQIYESSYFLCSLSHRLCAMWVEN